MSTRIARVRIPATFEYLQVEPTKDGARILIGRTHIQLKRDQAIALANAVVDATEKETP